MMYKSKKIENGYRKRANLLERHQKKTRKAFDRKMIGLTFKVDFLYIETQNIQIS